jgi:hypothetical protein
LSASLSLIGGFALGAGCQPILDDECAQSVAHEQDQQQSQQDPGAQPHGSPIVIDVPGGVKRGCLNTQPPALKIA